ncbi:hypothetical protein [Saccharothrix sp. NRRL B-16348]|nr:hypothetical protein [Saccharothrix sp. NRRL B-16348]
MADPFSGEVFRTDGHVDIDPPFRNRRRAADGAVHAKLVELIDTTAG